MGVGMLVVNRVLSSILGILMINHFFDPRGKSKKTNQLMYGTVFVEVIVVIVCYFYGSYKLLSLVEVLVVASLFFSFYPLFFAKSRNWIMVFLTLSNINILITCIAGWLAQKAPIVREKQILFYYLARFTAFIIVGIFIIISGRELFYRVKRTKKFIVYEVLTGIISLITIPTYLIYVYEVLRKSDEKMDQILFSACVILVFVLICYSIYFIFKELLGKQEQVEYEHNENLLRVATSGLEQRIEAVDEYIEKLRVVNHDRRHFNIMLLELLNQGEIEKAKDLLEKESNRSLRPIYKWCENPTVNVAIGHYLSMAKEKGISLFSKIDIPREIKYDTIGFSMMLGNLIENAIQACEMIENGDKVIWIKVIYQGQFIIELENTFEKEVEFDQFGYPVAKRSGHGFGTRSVESFVKENQGEIVYSIKSKRFSVRIILP